MDCTNNTGSKSVSNSTSLNSVTNALNVKYLAAPCRHRCLTVEDLKTLLTSRNDEKFLNYRMIALVQARMQLSNSLLLLCPITLGCFFFTPSSLFVCSERNMGKQD